MIAPHAWGHLVALAANPLGRDIVQQAASQPSVNARGDVRQVGVASVLNRAGIQNGGAEWSQLIAAIGHGINIMPGGMPIDRPTLQRKLATCRRTRYAEDLAGPAYPAPKVSADLYEVAITAAMAAVRAIQNEV